MTDVLSDKAELICTLCTAKVQLDVSSSGVEGEGKKIATTKNCSLSGKGGTCLMTKSPCQPKGQVILPGQSSIEIDGSPACGTGAMLFCAKLGMLSVANAAQSTLQHSGATGAATGDRIIVNVAEIQKKTQKEKAEAIKYQTAKLAASARKKRAHLPAAKKVKIDMEEVLSGHTKQGNRSKQSKIKDLFPDDLNEKQIEKVVVDAYKRGKIVSRQGNERVCVHGAANDGYIVEMWVNTRTKTIETAYPKWSKSYGRHF